MRKLCVPPKIEITACSNEGVQTLKNKRIQQARDIQHDGHKPKRSSSHVHIVQCVKRQIDLYHKCTEQALVTEGKCT
jgi:hypothetical protein